MRLTAEHKTQITAAVAEAEAHCGVEVVVVGYDRADGYLDVALRNALAASLAFPIVAASTLGVFFLSRLPGILRLTSGAARRSRAVDDAVARAFVGRGVYKTRERVGLLLVWFDLEQTVRVMLDTGLESRIPVDVRNRLVADLAAAALDDGRRAAAIAAVGPLVQAFIPRSHDDVDELDNAPGAGDASALGATGVAS
jgi:uncharacterized membrane protein